MIRRAAAVVLIAVGLTVVGPVVAASAGPTTPMAAGPLAMKACAPAPEPASPSSSLAGHLFGKPTTASDADPFRDPGVRIADVYGYDYAWVDYDNGCLPGSSVWANAQTGIGNFVMSGSASVAAFTHSLFGMVVTPDFMAPLDDTLTNATSAIKGGFWDPWVTAILLLVGAGILVAAMRSEVSSAVTTVGWALLVLVGATYVMSYPVASARAVDSLVQTTVAASAQSVGVSDVQGPPVPGQARVSDARAAIDGMFDTISRDTFYAAWLEGTLGSSDSAVARKYGPDLFRSSHLTWSEAETVRDDPDAGRAIVEDKQALWSSTAAAVEGADSTAYAQLTGARGRWDAAGSVALRVLAMFPFLVIAAVFIVIAYVATRVFVPLAPGFAVVGLMYVAQGWVIGVLKQVGRFVVLGPLFFVGALANLLLVTAVLDSDLAFALQLVIMAAIPVVLFKLLRPGHAIPGARMTRWMMRSGFGTLVNALATRKAVAAGVDDSKKNADDENAGEVRREAGTRRSAYPKNGPVAMGDTLELTTANARPHELPAGRRYELPARLGAHAAQDNGAHLAQSGERELPRRPRRELAAVGASPRPSPAQDPASSAGAREDSGGSPEQAASTVLPSLRSHPAIHAEESDVDLSAPVDAERPTARILGDAEPIPIGVQEATTTFDAEGNPIFQIWHPPAGAAVGDEDEEFG